MSSGSASFLPNIFFRLYASSPRTGLDAALPQYIKNLEGDYSMITGRELTSEEKEALAKEVRQFLIDNELWTDVRIYFNGKAFSTSDRHGKCFYNDPENLVVLEDEDPRNYFKYVSDDNIMSMSFEGDFYGCLNFTNEYGADFDNRIREEFDDILEKYGVYHELGHPWNLTCCYSWR